ncbi:hypothetical protein KSP40_PGU012941 [Platanthera guangdongensis]|uniref:Uncharacterized protein n=1 Tax=Platanthera guangdongensis TaxID=2320717 RepID=A0ABR2N4H8_9ASPA
MQFTGDDGGAGEKQACHEVMQVSCECCGMEEDCTATYITRVREYFYGRWICGLCSEAVKEKKRKRKISMEEALVWHMELCIKFNRRTRVDLKLSFAGAVKEMAAKSSHSAGPDK